MLIDTQLKFSDAQSLTATAISTNVVDLRGNLTQNPTTVDEGLTIGQDFWLVVQVITAAAGGDAAKTLTITLESAADAGLSSGPVVHFTTTAITGATLIAGYQAVRIQLPSADYKRYLGLRYTVSASFTAFTLTAFMTPDIYRVPQYGIGYTVQ